MISQTARFVRSLAGVLILASFVGCASHPAQESRPPGKTTAVSSDSANMAAAVALSQVGVPYQYGGSSPNGFDCSGLIHYSYAKAGKSVPRTTATLWSGIEPVASSQMQVGDVLFFNIEGKMSHVGMYIGDSQFVHAPSSGKVVSVASLQSDFYRKALIRAGRPE